MPLIQRQHEEQQPVLPHYIHGIHWIHNEMELGFIFVLL